MPMMMPLASDVHVDKMLTNVLVGTTNEYYIADQGFPVVMVDKQTDIIPQVDQSHFFRNDLNTPGADGDVAPEIGYKVTTSLTYLCKLYHGRHFISDERRVNEDNPFNSDRDGVLLVDNALRIQRELAFVSNFWALSKWTTDVTGGTTVTKWSDYGSSTPLEDIRKYRRTVFNYAARYANKLILGNLTRDRLMDHPDVLDRIKYTERGIASEDLLKSLFGVDSLLVGQNLSTATAEGVAEASVAYTSNWDDDALLLYTPTTPSIWQPSAGYTFVWRIAGVGNEMQAVRKYRNDEKRGDYVEVNTYYDNRQINANLGVFFSDIVD